MDKTSLFPIPRGNHFKRGIDLPLQEEWEIPEIETLLAINDIGLETAPGPDGFNNQVLKEGGAPMVTILNIIFNISLKTSTIPTDWKEALITPIYKSKEKSDPSNYRPISLTSQVAKSMEKIIKKKIVTYLNPIPHDLFRLSVYTCRGKFGPHVRSPGSR